MAFKKGGRKGKGRDEVKGAGGGFFLMKGGRKGKGREERMVTRSRRESSREDEDDNGGASSEGDGGEGSEVKGETGGVNGEVESFLRRFAEYLQSAVGGSKNSKAAHQVVVNVRKYLNYLDPGDMQPERLLGVKTVPPYIECVQEDGIGSSGILQRLDAHSHALKYINFSCEEEGIPARVQRGHDFLRSFRRSFQADKVARERDGIEAKAYSPPDLSGVEEFLSSEAIHEEFFETADGILGSDVTSKSEYNICLAIAAGRVLYSNAQRPAAITGAKMSEYFEGYKAQKKGERYTTIRVYSHKTGSSETAKVVFSRTLLKVMKVWEEVRDKVAEDSPFLFPNYKGEEVSHLSRRVIQYAVTKGIVLVKPQTLRTAVELKAKDLPAPVQEALTRSLSHSMETARKYYRANNPQSGHMAFETIRGIVAGKEAGQDQVSKTEKPPTSPPKRRHFTSQETDLISKYFEESIAARVPPVKTASKTFLQRQPADLFVGRSEHDIYDKVRNLIGGRRQ